jgi:hypothetical protein
VLSLCRLSPFLALLVMVGCAPALERGGTGGPGMTRTSSQRLRPGEESLEAVPRPRIDIRDLREVESGDPGYQAVVGTIVNSGDKETSSLAVTVYALDAQDGILAHAPGVPDSQRLPAAGGMTHFTASFVKRADIDGYKVEAVAR